jgi:hypothetical protein
MKISASSKILFLLGFVLLVVTNIIVLAGVSSNRSGNPEAMVTLTERELQLPYRLHKENSGLTLQISWRVPTKKNSLYERRPDWLTSEKLKELGFTIDPLRQKRKRIAYRYALPKEVFIVLEYNGESYMEAVREAQATLAKKENLYKADKGDKKLRDTYQRAEKDLKEERISRSRLFAIDAGLDPKRLREAFPDRSRFIITRGVVRPDYGYTMTTDKITGYVTKLSNGSINVPLDQRKIFDPFILQKKLRMGNTQPPRYDVKLAYGSRLEPWIVSAKGKR